MGNYKLAEAEEKFAEIIWAHEPISSSELVKVCEKEMNYIHRIKKAVPKRDFSK